MKARAPAWLALGLIALAGCGSGGATDSTTTAALSHDELVSAASRICDRAKHESDVLTKQLSGISILSGQAQPVLERLVQSGQALISDLSALTPPPDEAAAYSELIASLSEGTNLFDDLAAAADGGDEQQVRDVMQQIRVIDEDVPTETGIDACIQ